MLTNFSHCYYFCFEILNRKELKDFSSLVSLRGHFLILYDQLSFPVSIFPLFILSESNKLFHPPNIFLTKHLTFLLSQRAT
jgi:hypothetical protein